MEANVGLRVYGHEGMRTGKTKEQSCENTELVYKIQPLDKQEFQKVIDPFEPTGWTPIGLSLEAAKEDFSNFPSEENTNLVYVVSDGAETCGGDPAAMAKELADSDIQPIINVIGFNVDIEGQSHLREIADAGGGVYANAGDEAQLKEAFNQAEKFIREWKKWKDGVEGNAHEQKSEQKLEALITGSIWRHSNSDEGYMNATILLQLLLDDHITRKAHDHFKPKMYERNELYKELGEESFTKLLDEIEGNNRELIKKINNAYNDKTGE